LHSSEVNSMRPYVVGCMLSLSVLGISANLLADEKPQIRLVLQITVDGLRGDLLNRYQAGLGKDGFQYLMKKGTTYTNAHYQHANTETIVGHATLATGANPSQHGLIGNVWFDREAKELSYNIEDPDAPILPTREESTEGDQVDPAQKLARTKGRSPVVMLAPTFGDGLVAYNGGRSKVFGVSSKDRSAVAMAGQVGKAFWYSTDNGDFVTSKYYYDEYPEWVQAWNAERKAEKYAGTKWELSAPESSYLLIEQDDRPYEMDLKGFGRTFPHSFGDGDNKALYTQILFSSVGDELLADFAKELIVNEKLGKGVFPDYLSVSFSGVDAVSHFFGTSSLENEETVRVLDNTLADFLKFVDKKVGLKHTLIVLSADHGNPDMPEYMTEQGYTVGRVDPEELVAVANKAGDELGVNEVVRFFYRPYLYLDEEKIAAAGLDPVKIEARVAEAVTEMEGIEIAVSTKQLAAQEGTLLLEQIRRNHHPIRSGDIYVAQSPYWFLFDEGAIANMHGSPWRYDTHVPIIFVGPGIEAQKVHRQVHPVDVAPSLAAALGMSPPAAAQGQPLKEVLE